LDEALSNLDEALSNLDEAPSSVDKAMPAVNSVAAGTGYFLKNPGNMKARLP
jgi:hypothetical protein